MAVNAIVQLGQYRNAFYALPHPLVFKTVGFARINSSSLLISGEILKPMRRNEVAGHGLKVVLVKIDWAHRLLARTHQLHVTKA